MNTSTTIKRTTKPAKERTSLFLDKGTLAAASGIAITMSSSNPHSDDVTVSAVLREAVALGLEQLTRRHNK